MLPPACAGCGAPLPPTPADPAHPEWCNLCAAQARSAGVSRSSASVSAPLMAPNVMPPPAGAAHAGAPAPGGLVVRTRLVDGLLTGVAAAGIAGALWWAVSSLTELNQWHFLALFVGFLVAQGVLVGTRRGGVGPAVLALVCSSAAVLIAVYFIDRSLHIQVLEDAGRTANIPLWQGFAEARHAVWAWVDLDAGKAAGWLLAPVLAVALTLPKAARPLVT